MKSHFVSELKAGTALTNEAFLIQDMALRKTKDGRSYLLGSFRDKTGSVSFIFWDVPEYTLQWVKTGTVVLVSGRTSNYKESLQITVTDLNQDLAPDMSAFLPTSQRDRQEMVTELKDIVQMLAEPYRSLVSALLLEDASFLQLYANAPAARRMHHAYIGGLLEHSLSMAHIAYQMAEHYPFVDQDLLLAGVLLHDMGKALEYDVNQAFAFSDDGRLVGHIVRAIVMIEQAAAQLPHFPEEALRQLVHLVAAHHGTHEWGSPVTPKTLEAILLHQIDLLDSRVQGYFDHLQDDDSSTRWTSKNSPMFGTDLRYPPNYKESEDDTDLSAP